MSDDVRTERLYAWNTLNAVLDAIDAKNLRLAIRIAETEIRRLERDD